MVCFDAPNPEYEYEKNTQWAKAAHRGMQSPDLLWREYWQRFNTFRVPISDTERYFKVAMTIMKKSKSKEDFERQFEKENEERFRDFRSRLGKVQYDIDNAPPSCAANTATFPERNLSGLEHFVKILLGYISDRKEQIESSKIVVEKQDHTEQDFSQERRQKLAEDETETLIREINPSPSPDPGYEDDLSTGQLPYEDESHSQLPYEDESYSQPPYNVDYGYQLAQQYKARQASRMESATFMRREFEALMPASDDAASHALSSNDDIPSIQQVPSLISNDSQDAEEGNQTEATHDGSRSMNPAKKRVRFDKEDISTPEPKRRKLQDTLAHAEIYPTPQTSCTSSTQPAKESPSRKRSRADEEEEDNGYKRQKIESLPHPPSLVSIATSAEDESADHLARGNSKIASEEQAPEEQAPESNNDGRKRRKQKRRLTSSRARSSQHSPNTRSSRRAQPSTLWELDSTGKPRSTQ